MSGGTPSALAPLSLETFNRFRRLIQETTGINMRDSKQILVSNRLRRRLASWGLSTYEEYYELLTRGAAAGEELPHFISAVSTNETYFFRENNHFLALARSVLPEILGRRRTVRVWSAGCSTGEEPYTLRIVADEADGGVSAPVEIIGTDISAQVIAAARAGIYRPRSLRLVPPATLARCFEPHGAEGDYRVTDKVRRGVDFANHNLLHDPPPGGCFDIIFCRNVMIYFDKETQRQLVDGIFADALEPRGYLFIGHSESLSGFSQRFTYEPRLKSPIYRRKDTPA